MWYAIAFLLGMQAGQLLVIALFYQMLLVCLVSLARQERSSVPEIETG